MGSEQRTLAGRKRMLGSPLPLLFPYYAQFLVQATSFCHGHLCPDNCKMQVCIQSSPLRPQCGSLVSLPEHPGSIQKHALPALPALVPEHGESSMRGRDGLSLNPLSVSSYSESKALTKTPAPSAVGRNVLLRALRGLGDSNSTLGPFFSDGVLSSSSSHEFTLCVSVHLSPERLSIQIGNGLAICGHRSLTQPLQGPGLG